MHFDQLVALLPCQSLEDFDLDRREEDSEQLLAAWSALWHPTLLADARGLPKWLPAYGPPPEPSGHLVVVPDCCETSMADDWFTQAETAGACVVRHFRHRDEIVASALKWLACSEGDSPIFADAKIGTVPCPAVDPDVAADFLALGYCHLQIELLTRKLRYMSNLDEAGLCNAALAAADCALAGDPTETRRHLQSAFDRLHEAREYFYPCEPRLLDLTLVASTTLGQSLRDELVRATPCNLLLSGEVVEAMAQREPETLDALRRVLDAGTAALLGGERTESPLPMLEPEAIAEELACGLAIYEKHLGRRPVVFGRRRFGLTPALPQILRRLGFTGAFHCTLDDGRFPTANQSRIEWEGFDGTAIEALGCLPLDAGKAQSFLGLAPKLSDAMSLDQTSTLMLAHWPGRACCWYDDLRRIAAYGAVLGRFSTITVNFDETQMAGQRIRYTADQYRSPYLKQDTAADQGDPISRWVRYFDRRAKLDARDAIDTLAALCGGKESEERGVEREESDAELAESLEQSLDGFAKTITGATDSSTRGCLLVNPSSFARQAAIRDSSMVAEPRLIEVPAMGFAWFAGTGPFFGEKTHSADKQSAENMDLSPSRSRRAKAGWFGLRRPKETPPLAEENVLRNEYCEIRFDPATGAIRSISDYHTRGAVLAQQIAMRLPRHGADPNSDENYTVMAADEFTVTSAGPVLGEMVCRGRLLDRDGGRVAGFRQTTRVWRGSRAVELLIELDGLERQPGSNPWDSYFAARFAWKDETSSIHRSVNLANVPTELTQFESPRFVDIRRDKHRTTLLCGGLPYHRRVGPRKLDTLLIVHGETARSFRLGIGIDVPSPTAAALAFFAPPLVLVDRPSPPVASGWLFHLDCRNVLATHWETAARSENSRGPTARGDNGGPTARGATAFRVRLLETDGRGVPLRLRCFREVASARRIYGDDMQPGELSFEGDRVDVPIGPHEWLEVEIELKR